MSNFFENLIERHSQSAGNIKPRLPGVFESDRITSTNFGESDGNNVVSSEMEQTNTSKSVKIIKEDSEKVKKETPFKRNTISNFKPNNGLDEKKSENQFVVKKGKEDIPKSSQINPERKYVSKVKTDSVKNREMKDVQSDFNDINQKTGLKTDQSNPEIKQVFGEPYFSNENNDESKLRVRDKNIKTITAEKQFTLSNKKGITHKNGQIGNTGLKLPERFNQWMNEPVRQSQPKEKENSMSPTIKVNIGRIEVKAIMEQGNNAGISRKPAFKPKLTLDDYLNQRNGGKQ